LPLLVENDSVSALQLSVFTKELGTLCGNELRIKNRRKKDCLVSRKMEKYNRL